MACCIPRRVALNISEGSDESSQVRYADLETGCCGAHIVGCSVVRKPSHDYWRTGENAGGHEEGTAVLDKWLWRCNEHYIAANTDTRANEHEDSTCFVTIG